MMNLEGSYTCQMQQALHKVRKQQCESQVAFLRKSIKLFLCKADAGAHL